MDPSAAFLLYLNRPPHATAVKVGAGKNLVRPRLLVREEISGYKFLSHCLMDGVTRALREISPAVLRAKPRADRLLSIAGCVIRALLGNSAF